ncbi:family 16 glycosylhydrolase [Aliiglaciecola sp. CAU 1673]|uniref:family 16 glycosylhydrolase n=1 Tax=Aliiglaciecola sp. CAU 1673 TaxID=3032595 RepID=UPI0023DAA473|nr:family 16 glycosylhydrolase [Aliiglaciecola sp. CAU 1673]MDF2180131.1 family 16 glycosylhydrolase [Aliiglaciecola sp. CAU 1673]
MSIKSWSALSQGIIASGLLGMSLPASAQQCQNPVPVWADEFNGNSVDTSKWEIMTGDGCSYGICGWGNSELQSYQAANLTVANGLLTITAKKQRVQSKQYTSGRIRTANMPNGGQWTNGRFEARIKIPKGAGLWPAFWMLPTNPDQGWPMSGEIDIMEATGQADMFAFGTLHYGQPWPNNQWTSGRILKQPDAWSDDFHEYAVEWEPNEMRWYVDDVLYSVKTPQDLGNPAYWTFENYQYHFLLNLAVGGNLGGEVDSSMLPQTMQVDYVRVYDHGQPSLTGAHIVEPNSSHTYQVIDEAGTNSSYTWQSPTGETSTGNSLNVNWGTTGGAVTVTVENSCGSYQLSMDVYVSPEQSQETTLDNYEGTKNLSYQTWTGTFTQGLANPAPNATNDSPLVAEYIRNGAEQWDVLSASTTAIPDAAPFISGEKSFYLDVYTGAPVGTEILIQLENSSVATTTNYPKGRHSKYVAHTTVRNAWQRLKFDLEDRIDGATTNAQVNSLVLLIAPDSFTVDTYYLDNLDIYAPGSSNPGTATSMWVQNVVTGTQGAGKGKKVGTATVTVTNNLGNPVSGATVSGNFTGSWNQSVSGVTGADGQVSFVTSTALSGGVTVNFCVSSLSGTLSHDSNNSSGLCQ